MNEKLGAIHDAIAAQTAIHNDGNTPIIGLRYGFGIIRDGYNG